MLRVPVIKGNLNKALKIFKKKLKATGILKELREKKYFQKKSTKRKLTKQKAVYKQQYLNKLDNRDGIVIDKKFHMGVEINNPKNNNDKIMFIAGPAILIFPFFSLVKYPCIITAPGAAKIIPKKLIAIAKINMKSKDLNSAKQLYFCAKYL